MPSCNGVSVGFGGLPKQGAQNPPAMTTSLPSTNAAPWNLRVIPGACGFILRTPSPSDSISSTFVPARVPLQQTKMPKRLVFFLLISLAFLAQIDDAWAVPAAGPYEPPLAGTDEYLPAERQQSQDRAASRSKPAPGNLLASTGQIFDGCRKLFSLWIDFRAPFNPPPLYVFMSLQR
jgi:hypothetical protein